MGIGGVADLIDTFHDGVQRGVVADGGVRPVEVVVDGAGKADDGDVILPGEQLRAGEGAVAADDDEGVDAGLDHVGIGLLAAFLGHERLGTGGLEDGAAALDGVGDGRGGELDELLVNQSLVAAHDADHIDIVVTGGAGDGTDGRVHAGCISSGSEDTDGIDMSFHCRIRF